VLHYWRPEKQQALLDRAHRALRPGGKLVLRDAAKSDDGAHRHVHRWEKFATAMDLNRTREGLHFQTEAELIASLKRAGFVRWEIIRHAGRGSNIMIVASV